MRVVYVDAPDDVILERRRLGLDGFDEMWDGELHMTPLPRWEHQGILHNLQYFFRAHWEETGEGVCRPNVGVKPPGTPDVEVAGEMLPRNYRGPDLVFLLRGHEDRVQEGCVVGPPDAVIEVRSPGDETYKKFPFFHSLGIPEVIVVHRDTKAVELYELGADEYRRVAPAANGLVYSKVLDTHFWTEANPSGGVAILHLRRGRFPDRIGTA